MAKKTRFTTLGLLLVLSLTLGALFAQPVAAQADPLASCDATVRALVWAAEDAYGYNWMTGSGPAPASAPSTDDGGDDDDDMDDEVTPEATETTKLTVAKVRPVIQQDATEEADDDDDDDMATPAAPAAPAAVTSVNCDAIRASVVAFIFAQNGMSMDAGTGAPSFTVEGTAITPNFQALMSGPQEVPGPGDADGQGQAWLSINGDTNVVCWQIVTGGIAIPATGAHIHVGAEGESGDVVVPLSAPGADGASAGCTDADPAIVEAILANPSGYYVNIHTNEFPAGAIRGQLLGAGN